MIGQIIARTQGFEEGNKIQEMIKATLVRISKAVQITGKSAKI